jgi:trimethylamine--corrinoid protein Co-methyltransferase
LEQIYGAALDILARIGLSEAPEIVSEVVVAAGGTLTAAGRLTFPPDLVERAIADAARELMLCGQRPEHDLVLGPGRVYTGTGGAAPMILDLETRRYRPSVLTDLFDAARITETLPHVHFFSRSLVARDMATPRDLDLNTAFAALTGTAKHAMVSASNPDHVSPIAEMCYAIAGSEAAFREPPFLSLNINHAVPPLRFHAESCAVMRAAVQAGIPVHANVFGQLGASSPVTLPGSVAQTMAEAFAGIVFAWLCSPSAQIVCGPRPMVVDLRTGAMSGGGGEQAQANTTAIQIMRRCGLPGSVIAGATDSKLPDAQAGYEKALSVSQAVQAGANLVTQACGMQAGLMGVSLEAYVLDNDMLGAVLRAAIPPLVTPETLAVDQIAEVVAGEGHFLGRPETFQRMKSDFLYPEIADRRSIEEWTAEGGPDAAETAQVRVREILAKPPPDHIPAELRAQLIREHGLTPPSERERPA